MPRRSCLAAPLVWALLSTAASLAGVPAVMAATPASAPVASPGAGTLTLSPCRLRDWALSARCGSLQRPLDPAAPQGTQITVHVAVVPAMARHKAPDPVVFFAGGPGQSAIDLAGTLASRYSRLGQRRDLVFIDQRGTGRSAPLSCPDDDERAATRPLAAAFDAAQRLQGLADCRRALQALPHGDLRFYTTALASADVDAVRRALGVARINVIGGSYGTRAALDYMRQFPQHVRRVVLDGVAPPDMRLPESALVDNQAALDAVFTACEAEAACRQRHPGLRGQWQALLQRLPITTTLAHPITGQSETVRIDVDAAMSLLRGPLYAPALAAALPAALGEAVQGRWSALLGLGAALSGGRGGQLASGMHFSVVCAEDMPPATEPTASAAPGSMARLYQQVCRDWPRGTVPAAFYSLPPAPVPTWLLSGGADPVTPPRHGERVAKALGAQARHIVVAQAGHGVTAIGCVREAVSRFITEPDDSQALQTSADCAAAVPRPPAYQAMGATP